MRHVSKWILLGTVAVAPFAASAADFEGLFKGHTLEEPGCSVGVSRAGQPATFRSYGSADLEHAVPVTADTIMEAGSVSKQFTATSILMLAQDGKLALTDDIRKYVPEMPDYGTPITINHLLTHTSGLRDWSDVSVIAGWPRSDVVRSNQEVLLILSKQKNLNFKPGEQYSYTNAGFSLAAIIVERVSGKTLPDFTRDRIFKPFGMTHTSWRDNFRRVVPNRAIAYRNKTATEGYTQEMPFEDTYGHGALLTTAQDLLTWNDVLTSRKMGEFVTSKLEEQAVLTNGRKLAYARGLQHATYKGQHEISHGGSTAAYRTWVGRYPDLKMSVAVLCNGAGIDANKLGRDAIEQMRTDAVPKAAASVGKPTDAEASQLPGYYLDERTGHAALIVMRDGVLKFMDPAADSAREVTLVRVAERSYKRGANDMTFKTGAIESRSADGEITTFRKTELYNPPAAELESAVGRYSSAEANALIDVTVKDGHLILTPSDRPSVAQTLMPLWKDTYKDEEGYIVLVRDTGGKVNGIRFTHPRVFSMTFARAGK